MLAVSRVFCFERDVYARYAAHVSFAPRALPAPAQEQKSPRLLWPLVEESLSEAEFLWNRLDHALDAHDHTLADARTWSEDRLLGALDGVALAGAEAIEPLLSNAVQAFEPPLVSVAVYLLALLSDPRAQELLEGALLELSEYQAPGFALALGRAGRLPLLQRMWPRMAQASGLARSVLLDAFAFAGCAPQADFRALLEDECAALRCSAASALRFVPADAAQPLFEQAFVSSDAALRTRAIAAGVARGNASCWWRCLEEIEEPHAESGPLLLLAAMLGATPEIERAVSALAVPELQRDALWALGFAGTAQALEACLAELRAGRREQLAAEAICAISGLDLRRAKLERAPEESEEPDALSEDGAHAVGLRGPDERLPLPDVSRVDAWWARERSRFAPGVRYLGGQVATLKRLRHALLHGPTRRRHALALQLAARSAGAWTLETRAFTRAQQAKLATLAALPADTLHEGGRAFGVAPLSET